MVNLTISIYLHFCKGICGDYFGRGEMVKKLRWYLERWYKYYIINPHYQKFYGSFEEYCRRRRIHEKKHHIK